MCPVTVTVVSLNHIQCADLANPEPLIRDHVKVSYQLLQQTLSLIKRRFDLEYSEECARVKIPVLMVFIFVVNHFILPDVSTTVVC
jgi:hypothetical protein